MSVMLFQVSAHILLFSLLHMKKADYMLALTNQKKRYQLDGFEKTYIIGFL